MKKVEGKKLFNHLTEEDDEPCRCKDPERFDWEKSPVLSSFYVDSEEYDSDDFGHEAYATQNTPYNSWEELFSYDPPNPPSHIEKKVSIDEEELESMEFSSLIKFMLFSGEDLKSLFFSYFFNPFQAFNSIISTSRAFYTENVQKNLWKDLVFCTFMMDPIRKTHTRWLEKKGSIGAHWSPHFFIRNLYFSFNCGYFPDHDYSDKYYYKGLFPGTGIGSESRQIKCSENIQYFEAKYQQEAIESVRNWKVLCELMVLKERLNSMICRLARSPRDRDIYRDKALGVFLVDVPFLQYQKEWELKDFLKGIKFDPEKLRKDFVERNDPERDPNMYIEEIDMIQVKEYLGISAYELEYYEFLVIPGRRERDIEEHGSDYEAYEGLREDDEENQYHGFPLLDAMNYMKDHLYQVRILNVYNELRNYQFIVGLSDYGYLICIQMTRQLFHLKMDA